MIAPPQDQDRPLPPIAEAELTQPRGASQRQKMAALRQLTAGISHDFNNLLTAILGGLEVTRRRTEEPRTLRMIDSSISAAQRGATLIAQLSTFAGRQNLRPEPMLLNILIQDSQDRLLHLLGPAITLTLDLSPEVWPVVADPEALEAALIHLAINASEAMPQGGSLRISTGNLTLDKPDDDLTAGDYARLTLQDSGAGMSDAVQAHLFEPFFTTKLTRTGTGLGLAQVYGTVRQSDGDVRITSAIGTGTAVSILLPRVPPQP